MVQGSSSTVEICRSTSGHERYVLTVLSGRDCLMSAVFGPGGRERKRQRRRHRRVASKVDTRLPEKGNSNPHGARPVHMIITMIEWIRTSRLSTKKYVFPRDGTSPSEIAALDVARPGTNPTFGETEFGRSRLKRTNRLRRSYHLQIMAAVDRP